MLYLRCLIFMTLCLVMPFVHSEEPERKVHTEEECKKICEDREGWMVVPAQLDHHGAHISRRKSKDRGNHQTRITHGRETDQSPRRINFTHARLSRQGEKCHCDLNAIEIREFLRWETLRESWLGTEPLEVRKFEKKWGKSHSKGRRYLTDNLKRIRIEPESVRIKDQEADRPVRKKFSEWLKVPL
ncbi:uncharacterized protein [Bemisia tabaci]|uniref:uncharacterized protein n=1 Tax=Bemisia tabaci TaxID=7038 RepID=UPI003B285A08